MSLPTFLARDRSDTPSDPMDHRRLAYYPPAIPGAGGIRKLRWGDSRRSKGKRGGGRIICYCFLSDEEIWLLTLYGKDEATDLSHGEKTQLRRALEAERAARKRRETQ